VNFFAPNRKEFERFKPIANEVLDTVQIGT
jgi:hypothetical protein